MFRLSPQLLIATTRALAGIGVSDADYAELPLAQEVADTPGPDDERPSWDSRFIQECGYWSHYEHASRSSSWPIPVDLTTPELGNFGRVHGILHTTPEPGDIFLMWGQHRRKFIHSGVVLDVLTARRVGTVITCYEVYTVEGDTDEMARVRGGKAMRVRRRLSPKMGDRFLRWVDLDDFDSLRIRLARLA